MHPSEHLELECYRDVNRAVSEVDVAKLKIFIKICFD
jgi:hypothetical protein